MDETVKVPNDGADDPENEDENNNNNNNNNIPMIRAKLPAYLAEAFGDLYEEDGLLVLGRGLGLLHLIASFCRFYADTKEGHNAFVHESEEEGTEEKGKSPKRADTKPPLVFVVGLRDSERKAVIDILELWGTPTELLPTLITNESGQGKDRSCMYARGGIFLITSRILIVDLLTHVAAPKVIDGMLVAHAENVTEGSTEAFILRIFKTQKAWRSMHQQNSNLAAPPIMNKCGFVKAFSDAADSIMAGFHKVDKILKALFVRRLYLYPRFHASVAEELERNPPYVDELHLQLSPAMKEIQGAIAAAVTTCIRELKKSTTLIQWTDADLTVENCVTTNFDLAISRQLEHDWHRLTPQTKHLVHDLRTLRTLFHYLLQYDCISFWKLINNIKTTSAAARTPSMWLLTPAAEMIFQKAKERMYIITRNKPTTSIPNPVSKLVPVLEEIPKWKLLRQILTEIKYDWEKRKEYKKEQNEKDHMGGARVLVMVKDGRTLETVKSYLVDGKDRTMTLRWLRYLEITNDRSRALAKNDGGSSKLSEESRLLLEEESRARNHLFGSSSCRNKGKRRVETSSIPQWKRKKRKVIEERSRGVRTMSSKDDQERRAGLDEAIGQTENDYVDQQQQLNNKHDYRVDTIEGNKNLDESDSSSDVDDDKLFRVRKLDEMRIMIHTLANTEGEESYLLLNNVRPDYVVLYDTDPSFIRSLEIHAAAYVQENVQENDHNEDLSKHGRLHVFLVLFEASAEEKNFLKTLEREQQAFQRLIQHKKNMAVPLFTLGATMTQEMQMAMGSASSSYASGTLPLSIDTRTGKGKPDTESKERRDIAVDVREFRSALPSILHQGGMRLAPVTLTVGDFVLSNVHCVERKSISDLFGSFASGRLFTQAEAMSKHYKVPCLLIEFNPEKTFGLQNVNEIGPDIRLDSITSKLALLVMHVPKLRILWSRSPHETLKIFKVLKANHEEVDVAKAVEIGSNSDSLELDGLNNEDDNNDAAREMLLRLPGVNIMNAKKVMKECNSIAELAGFPRERLKELLGPISGQKLFTFFHQKYGSL